MAEKKDIDEVELEIEAPGVSGGPVLMPKLPKPLTIEEKKYLLSVERGDLANVKRMLRRAFRFHTFDVNCMDPLGRGALTIAIESENLEMVELLVVMGVETKDALLHAIDSEFVEAVELLLEHEEIIHKDGEPYSWQKMDRTTATFTPDITPLTLAAKKNNYEILKLLLDRGATLPMPHDIKCGCEECLRDSNEDSLRHSLSRLNQYRALASPSLIALSSSDPILTAFELSWELRNLAFAEQEYKSEYMSLRQQCQQFAVDLLDQSRSSQELAIILNHDPEDPPTYEEGEHMKLSRLELAINYKQKKFVAHANIQQLLAAIWYEGLPGFRRKPAFQKLMEITRIAVMFPFYCMLYMIAPNTSTGKLMRKPFMKFLIHASSYLFFLFLLILVSQRAEIQVVQLFGTESMKRALQEQLAKQRGNSPMILEWVVLVYVLGFIWEETAEICNEGIRNYLRNMWNFIDFTRNSLYVGVAILRVAAFIRQTSEISKNPATAYIPREEWEPFDPQLIAEGLFAAANIFSALKLVHLFSINPHLGPLQISLGRMVIDIVKFFFIYSLVLFAFACGLNQLLWYYADLEKQKCYSLPGEHPDWEGQGDACMKWRRFGNLFESSQSLFWASFGGVGIDSFELTGIKTYTRFWGLLMFGCYSVINVIVLLNLLIAMMSNSFAMIDEHSDTEWKFARTRLWMSYFEESATLPPPFNIFPTPKYLFKLCGLRKKDKIRRMSTKRKNKKEKERDFRYTAVMRALVWRYICAMHRQDEENPVNEDDINEVKGEVSAMKCEILEVLRKNGMDITGADAKEKMVLGKKTKVWERQLMKDFQVAPVAGEEELEMLHSPPQENEDPLARFRRVAKLAVLNSASHKWDDVVKGACKISQIGRCNRKESFTNQQNLQKAMEQARKLATCAPITEVERSVSPLPLPNNTAASIMELLKDITEETQKALGITIQSKASTGTIVSESSLSVKSNDQRGASPLHALMQTLKENENKSTNSVQPTSVTQCEAASSSTLMDIQEKDETTETVSGPTTENTIASDTMKSIDCDPSPLISSKGHGGDSAFKVVKRKASAPLAPTATNDKEFKGSETSQIDGSTSTKSDSMKLVAVKDSESSATLKIKDEHKISVPSACPISSTTDSTKVDEKKSVSPCKFLSQQKATTTEKQMHAKEKLTSVLPDFKITMETSTNSTNNYDSVSPSTSTEHLVPAASPTPLRPARRIEDVSTIKRVPKTGWL